jgi:putative ABC transport system permease protein
VKHFPLVWAALWRKPTETVLLLAAITSAFTLFGLMTGMREAAQRIVAQSPGDRLIINPRYDAPNGLPSALTEQIRRFKGVTAVGIRTSVSGYRSDPREFIWVDAVDEEMRHVASELPLTAAQWARLFSTPSGVFISRGIAQRLQLREGDHLIVTAPIAAREDGGKTWEFDVLGVVANEGTRNGNLVLGNYHYVDQQRPEAMRGRGFIGAAVASDQDADRMAVAIDRYFANSGTTTASITSRAAQQNMNNDGLGIAVMTWGIGSAGLFMILILVGNAIAQSVRERIPEFAILRAVGYREQQIAGLVVTEAAFPCVAGAILGMFLAKVISMLPRDSLPDAIRNSMPVFPPTVWSLVLSLALLLAVAGALAPLWTLRRLKVAAALVAG